MIYYLCDKKKCEDCSNTECTYTSDISHALNFQKEYDNYVEVPKGEREHLRQCTVNGKKAYFHRWADKEIPRYHCTVQIPECNGLVKLSKKSIDRLKITKRREIPPPEFKLEKETIKTVVGIIEYEDGTVAEVEPTSIKFDV